MAAMRTVAGQTFELERETFEHAVADALPEPLRDHYVVVSGRRFPPKQVLALVTGLDRADFTTHQARRILQRAGFVVGRVGATTAAQAPLRPDWPQEGREAESLRPFRGQWVAQRGLDVLVAANSPQRVVQWLNEHEQYDAVVFRVPLDEAESDALRLR
ncbi:MAG: hypothetical protein M3387_03090 [Actinomycetota bacterium]|nr:hypothetical protein [Actinomycetota bacterium]